MIYIVTKVTNCEGGRSLVRFHQGRSVEVAPGVVANSIVQGSSRRLFIGGAAPAVNSVHDINVALLREVVKEHDGRKCTYWELA